MNIQYAFKHMNTSDAIKTHAGGKSEKFRKFSSKTLDIVWSFEVFKEEHIAHVKVLGDRIDIFAEAKDDNMYKSIDHASKRIEEQLQRLKEKRVG